MSVEPETKIGLGDPEAQFKVYIANRPNFENLPQLTQIHALSNGEIYAIGQACGNGWRKVFNVYAKLVFALNMPEIVSPVKYTNWQAYREQLLLQANSNTSLMFSKPALVNVSEIHLVMGKTYGKSLELPNTLVWLDNDFAIDTTHKLIVCPYFDYRQLSNIKIVRLVELIKQLTAPLKI